MSFVVSACAEIDDNVYLLSGIFENESNKTQTAVHRLYNITLRRISVLRLRNCIKPDGVLAHSVRGSELIRYR